MRIDIVTDTFAPDINGVAMTLGRLVDGLRDRGHLVHVIRSSASEENQEQAGVTEARSIRLPGYKEIRIGFPRPVKFRKRWTKKRPDAVYVATESPLGFSAVQAAKSMGISVATGFHTNFHEYVGSYKLGGLDNTAKAWLKNIHTMADLTMAPSSDVIHQLKADGIERVGLLGRGVDTELFHPQKRDLPLRNGFDLQGDAPVVIVVGRIAPEKNLQLAIHCIDKMCEQQPNLQPVFVGDGPLREQLQKENPHIHFPGVKKGEDLARYYASADILLFPSETETFGNVLLEGMASGLITVSYDYAASKQHVIDGRNGLKAAKGNEEAFVKRAVAATNLQAWQHLRESARSHAEINDWDKIIKDFESMLGGISKLRISPNMQRLRKDSLDFRSVFVSDIHLGTPESKAREIVDFLKHVRCENLFLNGDIIDGWALKRGESWTKQHTKVIRAILKKTEKEGTKVTYIRGNHDDILDSFLPISFGPVAFKKKVIHQGLDGKRYLIVHGDGFDSVSTKYKWIAVLGAFGYDSLLKMNRLYNKYRRLRGKPHFSFSKKLKASVKSAVSFVDRYEEQLQQLARQEKCDGIICGHIHTPEDKQIEGIRYLNSGDWVESLSCVVEHLDGQFEVIYYTDFLERLGALYNEAEELKEVIVKPETLSKVS